MAPTDAVGEALTNLAGPANTFVSAVDAAIANPDAVTAQHLTNVYTAMLPVISEAETLMEVYVIGVSGEHVTFSSVQIETVYAQIASVERLKLYTLAIYMDFEKEQRLRDVNGAQAEYTDVETALIAGSGFVGLPATIARCTLTQMGKCREAWPVVRDLIVTMTGTGTVSADALVEFFQKSTTLKTELLAAAAMYTDV